MSSVVTALSEAEVLGCVESGVLIDGRWRPAEGGGTPAVENPATGRTVTSSHC
jgi:succinate-semialdehyde dehydrogenase/glutarate-semialdehyde dehydrogenase